MASLKLHRQRWQTKVRIPASLVEHYGGRAFLYRHLATSDRRAAQQEADLWESGLRVEWAELLGSASPDRARLRKLYAHVLGEAVDGAFVVQGDPDAFDEVAAGIGYQLDKLADEHLGAELPEAESVRVMALNDAIAIREGRRAPHRKELEPTFQELAEEYLKLWRTQQGLKATNTEQQKVSTFHLFGGYWGARPIREVRKKDAAEFLDALRQMDPLWARSTKSRELGWERLQKAFGGRPQGLSDATINRHMAALKSLWAWAQERDYCEGNNPFGGFHKRLKDGRNVKGYLAWEPDELRQLFDPPPKRQDVAEVMIVALLSGMRLDEIASLTRGQIKTEAGVTFVHVLDAKTEAGVRRVPLHPQLGWLVSRANGDPGERIWPRFNLEGPGKKAGADAGKEFSRFKLSKGFTSRRKSFHAFRKNFVGQLEERGVPQSEVAQLVGHEKGFTFGKYGAGVSLQRLADIIAMIGYPEVPLPHPSSGSRPPQRIGASRPPQPRLSSRKHDDP